MGYDASRRSYFFTVKNQGAAAAGAVHRQRPRARGSFADPGPGRRAPRRRRTYRTACKVGDVQQAIADSLGQVAESDETNNTRSYTETICLT